MKWNTNITYIAIGIIILVSGVALYAVNSQSSKNNDYDALSKYSSFSGASNTDMKIYKSMNCGCCGLYSRYATDNSEYNVETIAVEDVASIKDEKGIPSDMRSCHTMIVGNYFVEGHVPLEAINKLMTEKPDIKGIALPGMPSGSPGMPGGKDGDFVIYQINNDGSTSEFMRI